MRYQSIRWTVLFVIVLAGTHARGDDATTQPATRPAAPETMPAWIDLGEPGSPPAMTLGNIVSLQAPNARAARLMPGGRQVLFIATTGQGDDSRSAYYLMNTAGSRVRKLCDAPGGKAAEPWLARALGDGCVSPSGQRIAAFVPDGDDGSGVTVAIIDTAGRTIRRLKSQFGAISGAVFLDENTVAFCDHLPLGRPVGTGIRATIRRIDLTTGTTRAILMWQASFVWGLQRSPDGKLLAGVLERTESRGGVAVFAYQVDRKKYVEVPAGVFSESPVFDRLPVSWTPDSRYLLFASKADAPAGPTLMRFDPYDIPGPRDDLAQATPLAGPRREHVTALVPGETLNGSQVSVWVRSDAGDEAMAYNANRSAYTRLGTPVVILDRQGSIVLGVLPRATGPGRGRLFSATLR